MTKRTAIEQRMWDEVAKAVVSDCFRRFKKVQGCTKFARDVADEMLKQRRDSQRRDTGR